MPMYVYFSEREAIGASYVNCISCPELAFINERTDKGQSVGVTLRQKRELTI